MKLAHVWILHFLWVLPLIGLVLIVSDRGRRRAMDRFAGRELWPRLTGEFQGRRRFLKSVLLLMSAGAMIFGLAGPQWGSHYQEVSQKGVDIMLVVDVSQSMMVEDVAPNRLERARREIVDFLRVVRGDRVGLVAFAGAAFVECPLTLDYKAVEMFLNALRPDLIPVAGTDLGAAIDTAVSAFHAESETDKVVVLITDGEDNEGRGLEAARAAAERGIKIFVFGIGETAGGPIPAPDGEGGFRKDEGGEVVLSKLDEQGLRRMASVSGGNYVRAVTGDLDLDILYFDGIRSKAELKEVKSGKIRVYEARFYIFGLAAFFLLLLEGLILDRKLRIGN